jgi:hypothetical protein
LKRSSNSLNPFFPPPRRGKGGNSAIVSDLAIPDYRGQPMEKQNLFAIIEIKFPGDSIKNEQFKQYDELSKACIRKKTDVTTAARINGHLSVDKGCRVALFRYPEDVAVGADDDKEDKPDKPGKPFNRRHH